MTGDLGARLADTADTALYLSGVVLWIAVIGRLPEWWRLHVKTRWHTLRWGLRFDLVDPPTETKGVPFRFEE